MYKIALLVAMLASAQAQLISNGTCNFSNITPVIDVSLSNFSLSENFFEIKRINNEWNTGQCISLSVAVNNETKTANIILKEVANRTLIERNVKLDANEIKENHYNVAFQDFNSNFTFLGVADKYVILYACSNVEQKKQEYSWVFSSNTTLSEKDKNSTENVIKKFNLNNATWVESSHTAEACENGGTNIKLSPIIVLILGFFISKV